MDYAGFYGKIQRSSTGLKTCFCITGTGERDYSPTADQLSSGQVLDKL
jgi:hypothetical protein